MPKEPDQKDRDWLNGNRAAWRRILGTCIRELGYPPPDDGPSLETRHPAAISEREDVIVALRSLCERFGDNDWDEHLHLADVINKNLAPYLNED